MRYLFIFTLFLLSNTAQATNPLEMNFGLAMHGEPKYTANSNYLDYVNPKAPKGGGITMAAIGTFDTLNPYSIKGKAAQGLNLTYDRLMARVWDEPFTMYPLIAERVVIPEDRSSITVHINPKARFHDGASITPEDVIFSFETFRDSGRPNMRQIYRLVKTVEKIDDLAVHFTLGEGFDRETVMIIAMMPVLSKKWWGNRVFDTTILDVPNLNGPYRIKSFEAGRSITYERNLDYWAADLLTNIGHHNFNEITYDYYRDDTIALEAFKSGDTQLRREWNAGRWESAYDFPAIYDNRVTREALPHGRPERARGLIFNTRRVPFDDIRVRKALSFLLDFEWLNKNIFHGRYKRINSYFPNSELAATGVPEGLELKLLEPWRDYIPSEVFTEPYLSPVMSSHEKRRHFMRLADLSLKEAGWIIQNGKRVKDGKVFKFELTLGAPEDEKVALHFKRSLEKIGIEITIRILDSAAYRGRMNEYDFDMTLYYWLSSLSPGTEQILYWSCKAADEPSRWNFPGICNPAIDALSKQVADTKNRHELVATMNALDRILLYGHYMIPLYYAGEDYVAYWNPIKHPETTPLYGMVLETWWMDGDQ